MERYVSVPSDQNIRERLWRWSTLNSRTGPTEICRSILTNRFVSLLFFTYVGNSEKEQKMVRAIRFLLVGPVLSKNVVPFSEGIQFYVSLIGQFGKMKIKHPYRSSLYSLISEKSGKIL